MRRGLVAFVVVAGVGVCAPAFADSAPRGATHELTAQSRPHITIYPRSVYPGRNAKRVCRSRLTQEVRVSGPVIVPKMQCRWE
jgi:hypothetical protein